MCLFSTQDEGRTFFRTLRLFPKSYLCSLIGILEWPVGFIETFDCLAVLGVVKRILNSWFLNFAMKL